MKIAHFVESTTDTPAEKYSGITRVAYGCIEHQVLLGHSVTVFCPYTSTVVEKVQEIAHSKGITTTVTEEEFPYDTELLYWWMGSAKIKTLSLSLGNVLSLVPITDQSFGQSGFKGSRHMAGATLVYQMDQIHPFDVIHTHDMEIFPFMDELRCKTVITMHNFARPQNHYGPKGKGNFVAISRTQAEMVVNEPLNIIDMVYNGICAETLEPNYDVSRTKWLAFLGRVRPHKGTDLAVQIAKGVNTPIVIAGPRQCSDDFFSELGITHHFACYDEFMNSRVYHEPESGDVVYVGEVNDAEKQDMLQQSVALIMFLRAPEAFGLVMPEANACGTPVIGNMETVVPEIVTDGFNGYTFGTVDQAILGFEKVKQMDRMRVRNFFDSHFTSRVMAENYLAVYRKVVASYNPLFAYANKLGAEFGGFKYTL